jgi:hypothetical protein
MSWLEKQTRRDKTLGKIQKREKGIIFIAIFIGIRIFFTKIYHRGVFSQLKNS